MRQLIYFFLIYLLYKVCYIEKADGMKGFFLLKRRWVWLVMFPVVLIPILIETVYHAFLDIFDYDLQCIGGEKRKLTFGEKLIMTDKLLN